MYIFKAIKNNSYIKQDNAIFEHTHHTQSLQNRPVFKDGIVVLIQKNTFYCFNDIHILSIDCWNLNEDNNYKLVSNIAHK